MTGKKGFHSNPPNWFQREKESARKV